MDAKTIRFLISGEEEGRGEGGGGERYFSEFGLYNLNQKCRNVKKFHNSPLLLEKKVIAI